MKKMTENAMRITDAGTRYRFGCSGGNVHPIRFGGWTTLTKASAAYQTHRSHHGSAYVAVYDDRGRTIISSFVK